MSVTTAIMHLLFEVAWNVSNGYLPVAYLISVNCISFSLGTRVLLENLSAGRGTLPHSMRLRWSRCYVRFQDL
jgi:hypothetical protein